MSSDVIRHCQSPTEKVSAKMVVIIGLLPYLLTYIFILKNIYYFRTCNLWTGFQRHIILALRKFDKSKRVSDKGFYFFLLARFSFLMYCSQIQKLRFYPFHTTDVEINFHILYSTQRIVQSTSAPVRKAEDSMPKTNFYWFRTATISALTVFPSFCKNLCSWYVDNVLVICSGDRCVTA